jgi:hypothetical protein
MVLMQKGNPSRMIFLLLDCIKNDRAIVGGDLNFTLNKSKVSRDAIRLDKIEKKNQV